MAVDRAAGHACYGMGVIRIGPIELGARDPLRCKLPIVAQIATKPRGRRVVVSRRRGVDNKRKRNPRAELPD